MKSICGSFGGDPGSGILGGLGGWRCGSGVAITLRLPPALARLRWLVAVSGGRYPLRMTTRERVSVDLDADVAAILRKHAAEAHLSEGEILDRAVRAYDLRALLARLQAQSDLDDDEAMALAREELKAVRTARRAAG
jgi:hypothetical protein